MSEKKDSENQCFKKNYLTKVSILPKAQVFSGIFNFISGSIATKWKKKSVTLK